MKSLSPIKYLSLYKNILIGLVAAMIVGAFLIFVPEGMGFDWVMDFGVILVLACFVFSIATIILFQKRMGNIHFEILEEIKHNPTPEKNHILRAQFVMVTIGGISQVGSKIVVSEKECSFFSSRELVATKQWSDFKFFYVVIVNDLPYILFSECELDIASQTVINTYSGLAVLDSPLVRRAIELFANQPVNTKKLELFEEEVKRLDEMIITIGKNKNYFVVKVLLYTASILFAILLGLLLVFGFQFSSNAASAISTPIALFAIMISNYPFKFISKYSYIINPEQGFVYFNGIKRTFIEWEHIIKVQKKDKKIVVYAYIGNKEDFYMSDNLKKQVVSKTMRFYSEFYEELRKIKEANQFDWILD